MVREPLSSDTQPDGGRSFHALRRAFEILVISVLLSSCVGMTEQMAYEQRIVSHAGARSVAFSPDSNQIVVAVDVDEFHPPNIQYPEGGSGLEVKTTLEILLFEMRHAGPLRRVAAVKRHKGDDSHLLYWDSTGVVVEITHQGRPWTYETLRIDPASGRISSVSKEEQVAVNAQYNRYNPAGSIWGDLRRRRVYEHRGRVFLWDPVARRETHLFDVPDVWDGYPPQDTMYRAQGRQLEDAISGLIEVWGVTFRHDRDSLRVTLETYSHRPNRPERSYALETELFVPASTSVRLPIVTTNQPLDASRLHVQVVTIAYRDILKMLEPWREEMIEWPRDSITVGIGVALTPRELATDPPGFAVHRRRSEEVEDVCVPLPPHWVRRPMPRGE